MKTPYYFKLIVPCHYEKEFKNLVQQRNLQRKQVKRFICKSTYIRIKRTSHITN